jgi:hypothetical protein
MLRSVLAEGVDEDVDVGQDHSKRFMRSIYSMSSSSWIAEKLVRSTPGLNPPVALLTGNTTRLRFAGLRSFRHDEPQPVLDKGGERAPLRGRFALGAGDEVFGETDGGTLCHMSRHILGVPRRQPLAGAN